jgi:hypothetical protein
MIELCDGFVDVDVQPAEYQRLLGYPRDWVLEDRARELADWARGWYNHHGRPWVVARDVAGLETGGGRIRIAGRSFSSPRLQRMLGDADAHRVVLVAACAGPELEAESQARWQDGKPDEYFFLEVYGSAVVEHLITMAGARLCAWAESEGFAVLPHYSPGYPGWDISEQRRLLDLFNQTGAADSGPVPIQVLESGMLRPKKSLLAVFGVTRQVDRVRRLTELVPCENCSFSPCQYRRLPYRRASVPPSPERGGDRNGGAHAPAAASPTRPLALDASYAINDKALRRWAAERLSLDRHVDGSVDATFRYEGTTCTDMGRPLEFQYRVALGPPDEGYPIRSQSCGPAPGDEGHAHMCRYRTNAAHLMEAIAHEKPLLGRPLDEVLRWSRPRTSAGCYCEPDSREHKWGLVLETIHYALANERPAPAAPPTEETLT